MVSVEKGLSEKYITLRSSGFGGHFPLNNPYDFTNIIQPALDLSAGGYEVALIEIYTVGGSKAETLHMVLCSIAEPRQVGESYDRIIKLLPLHPRQSLGDLSVRTFKNLQYSAVAAAFVDSVNIKVISVTASKELDQELNDGAETILTLHIRRSPGCKAALERQ